MINAKGNKIEECDRVGDNFQKVVYGRLPWDGDIWGEPEWLSAMGRTDENVPGRRNGACEDLEA